MMCLRNDVWRGSENWWAQRPRVDRRGRLVPTSSAGVAAAAGLAAGLGLVAGSLLAVGCAEERPLPSPSSPSTIVGGGSTPVSLTAKNSCASDVSAGRM